MSARRPEQPRDPQLRGRQADLGSLRKQVGQLERQIGRNENLAAADLSRVEVLAQACAPLSQGLAGRIVALRRRAALQSRRVPAGVLDDLVASVRAQVVIESKDPERYWRRAGLSHSFLDAPRQLAIWRRMAVAALLVVGVGAGALLSGVLRFEGDGRGSDRSIAEAPRDPRLDLLLPDGRPTGRPRHTVRSRFPGRSVIPGDSRFDMVGDGSRLPPASAADTTVVFPMRDLSSPNVSHMLDGLAIPDIGSARVIEDN